MTPADFKPLWSGQRAADSPLKLVGVRGALEIGHPNRVDIYDDLIFVVDENAGTVTAWLASVDPSLPLILNPINPDGCAQLVDGVHLFGRGIHKGNTAWPCLIQAEDFTIDRLDTNGNVKGQESGDFGIHLHSGGTGTDTKRFSAGCQIIHNGDGYFQDPTWSGFIQTIYAAMKAAGIAVVPYLLMDAADFTLPIPDTVSNPVTP